MAWGIAAARPLDGERTIPTSAWRAAWPVFGYEMETIPGFGDHPAGCVVLGSGHQVMLAVRIVEAACAGTAPPAKSPAETAAPIAAPTRPGIEAARAWMHQNVAGGQRWKRESAIGACVAATGCRRDDARAAWRELPATLRGRPGRPAMRCDSTK